MDSVMRKIIYQSMPCEHNNENYRTYLAEKSDYSCIYCTITESESPGATFNIDHFRPTKHFPHLKTDCSNLRYSCPRCNSYKRDNWIDLESGCSRECSNCQTKICTTDILRFIDCLVEDPKDLLEMDSDCKLVPIHNSKPADYSIEILRLNRVQLLKIRSTRKFINEWEENLNSILINAKNQLDFTERMHKEFLRKYLGSNSVYSISEKSLIELASDLFQAQVEQQNFFIEFVNYEIKKLKVLNLGRLGSDSVA